jgi:hypothetical protein
MIGAYSKPRHFRAFESNEAFDFLDGRAIFSTLPDR